MRVILAAFLACGTVFFAVPVLAGGKADLCGDAAWREAQGPQNMLDGSRAGTSYEVVTPPQAGTRTAAQERSRQARLHPHTPPALSCAASFWAAL